MAFGNWRPFWHMVFVGFTGVPTFMTTYYFYQLQTQLGMVLVIPIAAFVAAQIFLLVWLGKHPNPTVRAIGEAAGAVFMYLALFQGLMLTVLVFYLLGGGETSSGPGGFYADFVIGTTYLSMFIYGATGATMVIGAERWLTRLVSLAYTLIALVPPFWLVFFREAELRAFAAADPGGLVLIALAYYVAMSVIGMWLFTGPLSPQPAKNQKGKAS